MVAIFASKRFCDKFVEIAQRHCPEGSDPTLLLAAFKNYYSQKNPDFGANHWYFNTAKLLVKTDTKGIRYCRYVQDQETDVPELTKEIAQAIGRERWAKTFLSPYPCR